MKGRGIFPASYVCNSCGNVCLSRPPATTCRHCNGVLTEVLSPLMIAGFFMLGIALTVSAGLVLVLWLQVS